MADPSMDKQELYVAASRSREETYLYATPEIRAERAEYAPRAAEREPLGHLAEAAGRDRAQTAAHDEALRAELRALPNEELIARREGLGEAAAREARVAQRLREERPMMELAERRYANAVKDREAAEGLGRRERKRELPKALDRESYAEKELRVREEMRDRHGPAGEEVRRERQVAREVLAERAEPAILASRLAPPPYIVAELGERPSDPVKAQAWDKVVRDIETYRAENGVTDRSSALGSEPEAGRDRWSYERAGDKIAKAQRRLERVQHRDRSMQQSHDAGMDAGMDIGL